MVQISGRTLAWPSTSPLKKKEKTKQNQAQPQNDWDELATLVLRSGQE